MVKFLQCGIFIALLASLWSQINYAEASDPTRPPGFAQSGPYGLSAIMIKADNRLAVINGKIVHVGETVGNKKIIKIESNLVVLDGPDGRMNLVLVTNPTTLAANFK